MAQCCCRLADRQTTGVFVDLGDGVVVVNGQDFTRETSLADLHELETCGVAETGEMHDRAVDPCDSAYFEGHVHTAFHGHVHAWLTRSARVCSARSANVGRL